VILEKPIDITPRIYQEWNGGPRPLPDRAMVVIKRRCGLTETKMVGNVRWLHDGGGGDVVEFKIVSIR